ncbi:MAG TPA: MBL fold metallo-hydrolase, partial [Clostridiales bacterium]|nr:MBL fold metallo-hydrolase [Clostridiales bacterium]
YIRFVISLMAKLPLAVFGAGGKLFSVWVFLAYGLGAVAYSISLKKAWRLVLLLFVLLLPALIGDAWVMRESVSVWALDMGSGQSIIFSSGGKTVVVDCGSQNLSASDEVLAHFRRYNLRAIDALVLTHLDLDHASGAEELLQKGLVKTLYMPRFQKNKELAQRLHITAQQAGTSVFRLSADERASVGNIRIHLFLPPGGSGGNASSLAVMAESRGASVLILGDINDKSDEYMAKTRDLPTVSVLVAGHHGAKTATSQTILEKTSPKYVIISVGRNSFGHPAPETLDRIEAVGAEVRRTDINGTIFYRFYKGRVYER